MISIEQDNSELVTTYEPKIEAHMGKRIQRHYYDNKGFKMLFEKHKE